MNSAERGKRLLEIKVQLASLAGQASVLMREHDEAIEERIDGWQNVPLWAEEAVYRYRSDAQVELEDLLEAIAQSFESVEDVSRKGTRVEADRRSRR